MYLIVAELLSHFKGKTLFVHLAGILQGFYTLSPA